MGNTDITELHGYQLSRAIRDKKVSCVEVMEAYLAQIEKFNPHVNTIVALQDRDGLIAQAKEKDVQLENGNYNGWLHGFPQAFKDFENTKGIPTVKGSRILKDNIPDVDSPLVQDMKAAGCIVIGKTNVPEWGYGSQTYNEVYGTTSNPYDTTKTSGGSSGGAAAALALRMQAVADGSDMMGSLRNPGGFCNVFGYRPSWGVVANVNDEVFIETYATRGPMGRTVADVALLLGTQAGYNPGAPLSLPADPRLKELTVDNVFDKLGADLTGKKIGWLGDWDGYLPMEEGVLELCEEALETFPDFGMRVEPIKPFYDPRDFWDNLWIPIRHLNTASLKPHYDDPERRKLLKPEAIYEYEGSKNLTADAIFAALEKRGQFYHAMMKVFEEYDFLAVPTAQVFPFDKNVHWPKEIAGRKMDTYHRWMEVVSHWTAGGNASISVPAGFGKAGLPMGLQLVAKPRCDFELLQLAYAYDEATRYVEKYRPALLDA